MPPVPPAYPGWVAPPPGAGGWGTGGTMPVPAGRLDLHVAEPARQARWKTLLRYFLMIPNALVLEILALPLLVVVPVMWLCALVTARVPAGLWRYARSILQWQARLDGYFFLLTDRYPPFSLHDDPYPVALTLDGPPEHLNRAAVLFRIVLLVPAVLASLVYQVGVGLVLVAAWFAALVTGRVPRPLHQVIATGLRYSLRYSAYASLLTAEYPWGLLGDTSDRTGALSGDVLTLDGGTKAFAVVMLVVGAVMSLFYVALPTFLSVVNQRTVAITAWNSLQDRALTGSTRYRIQVAKCTTDLPCVQEAASILRNDLETQIHAVGSIMFPTVTTTQDARELVSLLRQEHALVVKAQDAPSAQAYVADFRQLALLTGRIAPIAERISKSLSSF